jgi:hypothetical protein
MNYFAERPMTEWVRELSAVAGYVVAIGDCATWGGIPAVPPNPSESTGVQFHEREKRGLPRRQFRVERGLTRDQYPWLPCAPRLDHPDFGCHRHRPDQGHV